MSLKKNGGPYNKKQQEERRKKVNELYFEKNLPTLKIAEILNVNRNTVNDDIPYCPEIKSHTNPIISLIIWCI